MRDKNPKLLHTIQYNYKLQPYTVNTDFTSDFIMLMLLTLEFEIFLTIGFSNITWEIMPELCAIELERF